MPGMSYEEKVIVLDAGEGALFYSDGPVEAQDHKGEMFGFPRLRALVAQYGGERSLGNLLLDELYSFTGEGWLRCSPTGRAMSSVIIISPDLALPRILGSTRTYKAELGSRKSPAST